MAADISSSFARSLKFAIGLSVICTFSLAARPLSLLFDRPLDEDGFYCFAIARNIARGLGITADGETLTNGFQPLWVFVISPLFYISGDDRIIGVRVIFVANALVHAMAGLVLAQFATRIVPASSSEKTILFWLTAALYCGSSVIWVHSFNGMETGILLLAYSSVLLGFTHVVPGDRLREGIFGAVLGILVLARIDAGFFVAVLLLLNLLVDRRPFSARIASVMLMGCIAALVTLPWWAWNVVEFGNLMPTSGRALQKFALSAERLGHMAKAIALNLTPAVYLGSFETVPVTIFRVVVAALLSWICFTTVRASFGNGHALFRRGALALSSVLVACLLLAIWYGLFSGASFFYFRYMAPLALVGVLLVAVPAMRLARFISARPLTRWIAHLGFAVCLPVLVFTFIGHTGLIFKGHSMLHHQVPLVLRSVPEGEWVAAAQSGTLGFLRDRVLNLDGRVNPEALARRADLPKYLSEKGVRWFADWPDYVYFTFGPDPEIHGWRKVETYESMVVYRFEGSK